MKINNIRTYEMYKKMYSLPLNKRDNYFKYEIMKPFQVMWQTLNVPFTANSSGYDVVMASSMTGMIQPSLISEKDITKVEILKQHNSWQTAEQIIKECIAEFPNINFTMSNITELTFGLFIADSNNAQIKINKGYTGFGGIPGYFMVLIDPNEYTLMRLPLAIAHEFNHQIRLCYEPWKMNINLGEYIILEGLAESFAASMYGEELIGPWVKNINVNNLNEIKKVFKNSLNISDFTEVASYMFGDELALMQGYEPVSVPYCAGYAVGYHLVKYYLKKTGKSIVEATLTPTSEILKACTDFWFN
ncbi:Zn-dependent protease [Clostridium sp. 'deep sea']|uniref:DUF2268 domain-containing protein n=1 Tax=Clostridium sp. 'deep sea' TaxID=2779445 RepID=UPI0018965AAC|nr:DUF2268 domain-containing putative Zn-dependent protease [Clostridium sp. 'deep sea']QOR35470.1 Zn-dependent protease [Clostridium sp. 'deep sea']